MKGIVYARVSSTDNRQDTSRQVTDLTQYANRNGIEVLRIFEEHISGAKRNEEREVLCKCLDYCFTNHVDVLLISELSRLGRNVDEVLANVKRCKDAHLNIYFSEGELVHISSGWEQESIFKYFHLCIRYLCRIGA